ncbi:hypothetical protein HIM_09701 [Hirsutella minnesotensis 3608]|uniref:Uncharacterized protein n=1 Tax=Hirsutella minnesotensis 3608 TaxID=1043627 RepID=A0A0F7ZS82_9HYPO|nr:hypothetical protein HIM_09701 [Hirsutella minnesotensis 3608]
MSPPQEVSTRGHARNKSSSKTSRRRSSTKGLLGADEDDALKSPPATQLSPSTSNIQLPRRSTSSTHQRVTPAKDFSFLLRPEIYHPLNQLNVPPAFRNSPKQPDPNVPLEQLLERGQFRAAAIAAVQELTGSGAGRNTPGEEGDAAAEKAVGVDPHDSKRIFELLYTRLACLTLIDATPLAAQEAKALEDLSNTRLYVDDATGQHLVPWELRILHVRLQALGFGDPRRAVMSYYDLAREARAQITKVAESPGDDADAARELWRARLHDLGLQVAGALIDMDDPLGKWQGLGARLGPGDEMVGVNAAVCMLYLGRMHEVGREMLEDMVSSRGASSHTLLFNLCTMYELCTDKHRALKTKLAQKVAALDESPAGWEKMNADFKL